MSESDKYITSEAQSVGPIKHGFSFREYELSIINHPLSLGTVFIRKVLAKYHTLQITTKFSTELYGSK